MSKKVAVLDDDNMLVGIKDVPNSRWKTSKKRIPVPDACDLDPSRGYRWDPETKAFTPLRKRIKDAPGFSMRAIAEGFEAIQKHTGTQLPESTRIFIDIWRKQKMREEGR